jgi:ethanolamine utilization microcompartment shell protein EutL
VHVTTVPFATVNGAEESMVLVHVNGEEVADLHKDVDAANMTMFTTNCFVYYNKSSGLKGAHTLAVCRSAP